MQQNNTNTKYLPVKLRGDKTIWTVLFMLAFISILSVYSSSYRTIISSGFWSVFRHIVFLAFGFVIMYLLHITPVSYFRKIAPVGLLFFAILLLLALILDQGRRIIGIQPSEFARIAIILYLAKAINDGIKSKEEFIVLILMPIGLYCGLIINSHTSTTILLGLCSVLVIFMGIRTGKFLWLTVFSIIGIIILYFAVYFVLTDDLGRKNTAQSRVFSFIDKKFGDRSEDKDATNSKALGITQDKIAEFAIHSAGVFIGKGPGNSKYRQELREAHNDFIYAIIIEEYGIAGGILIIVLYLILFYRTIRIIGQCNKIFSALMSCGLILTIIIQTCIHIGVSVGCLPVTGQNLPLISTGGTSTIVTCMAFGMILSVSRQIEERNQKKKTN